MRLQKKDITGGIASLLRENNVRKPVRIPKYKFHITDDEDNKATFTVRKINKTASYTAEDVDNILTAFADYVADAIKRGDEVMLYGFGLFSMKMRKDHRTIHPETKQEVIIPAHNVFKFVPGTLLETAVKLHDAMSKDGILDADRGINNAFDNGDSEDGD